MKHLDSTFGVTEDKKILSKSFGDTEDKKNYVNKT